MQTTLRICDETYRRAKAKSGELGMSLTRFFEEAVEERLASLEGRPSRAIKLPVSSAAGNPLSAGAIRRRIQVADEEYDSSKAG